MIQDYFRLAYRSTEKRKLRSWLTMMGIFIGIAAVVALISLSQGLRNAIQEQFLGLGSDKLIVQAAGSGFGPPGTAVSTPLKKGDEEVIEKVKGVDLAVGRLLRVAKLEYDDEIKFSYVVSMPEEQEKSRLVIEANNYKIESGRVLESSDKFKVMVGHDFAQDFFEKELGLRKKMKLQGREFEVVGILKKSGNPQQDGTLVVPEEALREVLSIKEDYDFIPVRVQAGESLIAVSGEIKKELRSYRNVKEGKEDFTIQTPENLLATLDVILAIVQGVLVGIAAISLLVGGIGIMNTMYTAVLERTKEIGIMKATGARNGQILFLFLVESGILGLLGGMIGVILGLAASKMVEFVAFQIYETYLIKASYSPALILGALLFAFFVGTISGALPARQAAQLKPVDALRK